jgi:predicted amidohydrolase YtcJ
VEHAQCIHPDDVPRFAQLGVEASVQPRHIPLDVPVADRWWGARAATRAYPLRSLCAAGAVLRLGTDAPVVPPDPGPNLAAAVARLPAAGEGDRPWHPAEALGVGQALAAAVAGPLRVGGPADVTVLTADPFAVPPAALASLRALCTISGGRVTAAA